MSRINELRRGKRSTKPDSEETPLIAVVVIADIQDDPDGVNPIQDATVRDESINSGQSIYQPFIDIQHAYRCGQLDLIYGFSVSGSGSLVIDDVVNGTGRLVT